MENINETLKIEVIDLRVIIRILLKRKLIIILGTLFTVASGLLFTFFIIQPIYEAQVLLRVSNPLTKLDTQNINKGLEGVLDNIQSNSQMTMQTHVGQIKSEALMERVIQQLRLNPKDFNSSSLNKFIEVKVVDNSNLILLKVKDTNPFLAKDLANTVGEEYIRFISEIIQKETELSVSFLQKQYEVTGQELYTALNKLNEATIKSQRDMAQNQAQIDYWQAEVSYLRKSMDMLAEKIVETKIAGSISMGPKSVTIISKANVPSYPVKPNKILNITIALVLGLFIFIPTAFLVEHLDYKVKTIKDVEEYLKIPVIGTIPEIKVNKQFN